MLVGSTGAGKTTLGRKLAKQLNRRGDDQDVRSFGCLFFGKFPTITSALQISCH